MTEVNVLIIEDNKEASAFLEKTLLEIGYKVWVVAQPKEGLDLVKNMPFAVVLTKVRSAKMNGVEVTQSIQRLSPETNVIVMTFYSFINSAVEAMAAGAYGYITKPFNPMEVKIVLHRAVERYLMLTTRSEKDYYAQLAVRDGLTGLFNRRYFEQLLASEFARLKRHATAFTLIMVDIDDFKNYNDTKGHPAGDELLRKAADVLRNSVREIDSVCRYGGEEFVIMLPQTDKKGSAIVAERLRVQANIYLPTTISIGVATFPDDAQESFELIQKADAALYHAKHTGKNKYCLA